MALVYFQVYQSLQPHQLFALDLSSVGAEIPYYSYAKHGQKDGSMLQLSLEDTGVCP
jgi:hypothetical protein